MEPIELTLGQFRQMFPRIHEAQAERYRHALNTSAMLYGIHTPQRYSAYAAQADHESAGLTVLEENLHYSGERLIAVWPKRFKDLDEAKFYAEAGPESIANRVYANRMGNGDEASGDGWLYRGGGPPQLTGKDNYALAEKELGMPLVSKPEVVREIEVGCIVFGWFWKRNDCNQLADHDNFDAISDRINIGHDTPKHGDANGYADRFNSWKKCRTALGLAVTGLT